MQLQPRRGGLACLAVLLLCLTFTAAAAGDLPGADPAFTGVIGATRATSKPAWPASVKPPAGAPNVVLVLLDDVGFAAASTFGGAADTPALDKLARQGLTYNRFHVAGICSPTRAALLAGRNHHQLGFGTVTDAPAGFPGYNATWPRSAASVAEVLKQNGYNTAAFGKWHNTPAWEVGPAGPFDRWPTGLGFEYFYGFMAAEDSQWEPKLYRNTQPVEPEKHPPAYHFTEDIVDDAIHWLHQQRAVAPDKPYFVYVAPGATHAPLHAPKEWIAQYRGKFDGGWDKYREDAFARQKRLGIIPADARLVPRPATLPAWDSVDPTLKPLLARQMELFAGYLSHTDHEIGRLLEEVRRQPGGDNTLVLYIVGDNGPSPEGGFNGSNHHFSRVYSMDVTVAQMMADADRLGSDKGGDPHVAAAWAQAMATPFAGAKQMPSTLGAIRDPLVVAWPRRIKGGGEVRSQFHHVIDIMPTILDAAGIVMPTAVNGVPQLPLEGLSMLKSFTDGKAANPRRTQYFEVMGNRGIYQDGWFAGATHFETWNIRGALANPRALDQDRWTLYNLDEDYSAANDLSARYPEKVQALQAAFMAEARRNQVLPLSESPLDAFFSRDMPNPIAGRTAFVYDGDVARLPPPFVPTVFLQGHRIEAAIDMARAGDEGVIVAYGGSEGGFTLYVKGGFLNYEVNVAGLERTALRSTVPMTAGRHRLAFEFTPTDAAPAGLARYRPRAGEGRLSVDGQVVATSRLARFGGFGHTTSNETFDVGRDLGSPVSEAYPSPFPFQGKVSEVRVTLQ